jgi:predicted RNA methylase
MRYYVQFPAGTGALVEESIGSYVADPEVVYADDSSMVFDSRSGSQDVERIPFAKNSFSVIADVARKHLDQAAMEIADFIAEDRLDSEARTFRVMYHVDGELVGVGPRTRRSLEHAIASASGQRVAPSGAGEEYWIVGRTDYDRFLFCRRHNRPKRPAKARGAISHELSTLLVAASRPRKDDVFLDPFAGSGSFVEARLAFPAQRIVYSDLHLERLQDECSESIRGNRKIEFLSDDALQLPSVEDRSVDVIVTDPPWGEYEAVEPPLPEFFAQLAQTFERVLRQASGRFVVLTARRIGDLAEEALEKEGLHLTSTHGILVNGHPATVLIGARAVGD